MIGAPAVVRGSGADEFGTVATFGGGGGGFGDAGGATRALIGENSETLGLADLPVLLALTADFNCDDPVTGLGGESRTLFLGGACGSIG